MLGLEDAARVLSWRCVCVAEGVVSQILETYVCLCRNSRREAAHSQQRDNVIVAACHFVDNLLPLCEQRVSHAAAVVKWKHVRVCVWNEFERTYMYYMNFSWDLGFGAQEYGWLQTMRV